MKLSRLGALCLAAVWFAACATAQEGSTPGTSNGGSSGSFSGGGTPGAAGTNAFGGTGAVPGGSGTTGTAGTIGSAGTGGLSSGGASGSGTGGAGGSGGSAPVFDTGVCAVNPTMSLSYLQSNTGQQITGQYEFSNTSDTPIALSDLEIRYFFSNEHTAGWNTAIYDSKLDVPYHPITGTTIKIIALPKPLDGADSYTEVTFTDTTTIAKGTNGVVSWDLQPVGYNAPFQVQSNDYSFNAADTAFTVWDHVAIYQGNTLVWGCVPKSPDMGAAGAGGDTGAAGDTGTAGAAGAG